MSFTDSRPPNMRPRPLTEMQGAAYPNLTSGGVPLTHWSVTCRDCGDLDAITIPATAEQAGLLQKRHLAEHLKALAEEIAEATR